LRTKWTDTFAATLGTEQHGLDGGLVPDMSIADHADTTR
jgi:hypothetical protein